jgi:diguanylate cyclase (GGDEF)-like protein/PAS domain S-box-containing protein
MSPRSSERSRWFLKYASDGIQILDLEGNLIEASDSFCQMHGYTREEMIGMNVSQWDAKMPPDELASFVAGLFEQPETQTFETLHRRKDGSIFDVEVSGRPLELDGKRVLYHSARDITEHKRAEEALRESLDSLREAEAIGKVGSYVLDIPAGVWTSSEVMDEIFGIGKEYARTVEGWLALIHPGDRAIMEAYFPGEVLRTSGAFDKEYRIIRQTDGAKRWVHGLGRLEFDAQGQPVTMRGLIRDITESKLAEIQLRESEERFRATFEQAAVGIAHVSLEGRILRCNAYFAERLQHSPEELRGLLIAQTTACEGRASSPDWVERIWSSAAVHQQLLAGAISTAAWEKRYLREDGSPIWAKVTVSLQRDSEGRALHFIAVVEDINARKEAEELLVKAAEAVRQSEERYRTIFHSSIDLITVTHLEDGTYVDVNREFIETMGFEREEVIGNSALALSIWADPRDRKNFAKILREHSQCRNLEGRLRKKNGEVFTALISAGMTEIDGVPCIVAHIRDISSTKAAEDQIRNLAFYDSLTGLPNRRLLLDRIQQALAAGERNANKQALLYIDLDNFKTLNDTLGHQMGDSLLVEAARRIVGCVHQTDSVARLGADEFAVLLEDLSEVPEEAAAQAEHIGERVLAAISQPYLLEGHECHSAASIGVGVFEGEPQTAADVLQRTEIAMFQAKAAGRNAIRFFSHALQAAVNARAEMEEDLRRGIKEEQFVLYYQPQVERGSLIGAEALVRWNHPKRGLLGPGEFIPLAEETGLILPLGDWILTTACKQIADWARRKETVNIVVAVNISARQFRQPDFVGRVQAALDRTGANPLTLKLELTESMLLDNIENVIAKMNLLKSRGLRCSLDDFGMGYSSLSYLKRLPLDQLKIDRTFVRDILVDVTSGAIAQTIISLGRAMGLSVIAEGVETEEQRAFLARMGCHSFQGFLFSPPLPLDEFERLLPGSPESDTLRIPQ